MERVKFISTPCPALVLQHQGGIFLFILTMSKNSDIGRNDKKKNAQIRFSKVV